MAELPVLTGRSVEELYWMSPAVLGLDAWHMSKVGHVTLGQLAELLATLDAKQFAREFRRVNPSFLLRCMVDRGVPVSTISPTKRSDKRAGHIRRITARLMNALADAGIDGQPVHQRLTTAGFNVFMASAVCDPGTELTCWLQRMRQELCGLIDRTEFLDIWEREVSGYLRSVLHISLESPLVNVYLPVALTPVSIPLGAALEDAVRIWNRTTADPVDLGDINCAQVKTAQGVATVPLTDRVLKQAPLRVLQLLHRDPAEEVIVAY